MTDFRELKSCWHLESSSTISDTDSSESGAGESDEDKGSKPRVRPNPESCMIYSLIKGGFISFVFCSC